MKRGETSEFVYLERWSALNEISGTGAHALALSELVNVGTVWAHRDIEIVHVSCTYSALEDGRRQSIIIKVATVYWIEKDISNDQGN